MEAGLVVVFSGQGQDAIPCLVCDPILLAATIEHQAGRRLGDAGLFGDITDGNPFLAIHDNPPCQGTYGSNERSFYHAAA